MLGSRIMSSYISRGLKGYWKAIRMGAGVRFGVKPGKDAVRSTLLTTEELPEGDWFLANEYFLRTGTGSGRKASEEIRRARQSGSTTGKRIWRDSLLNRTLSCWVIPFANDRDAEVYMPTFVEKGLRTPFSNNKMLQEGFRTDPAFSDWSDPVMLYEMEYLTRRGPGGERLVMSTVNHVFFALDCSALGDPWTWEEIRQVAHREAHKIEEFLAFRSPPS